jgi:hypothetical protein
MKIVPVGVEFHANGRADSQAAMTNPVFAFRFAKAPK